jgi:hypothetical protein
MDDMQHIVAYHLEMIYGTEFDRSEAFRHINDGGYLTCIEPGYGYSRGLYACAFSLPKDDLRSWGLPPEAYPSVRLPLNVRKKIHQIRKSRWKQNKFHFGSDYYILHTEKDIEYLHVTDHRHAYPQWAEDIYLKLKLTAGSTVHDLTVHEILEALSKHPISKTPVSDYLDGLQEYYRIPLGVDDSQVEALVPVIDYENLSRTYDAISPVKYSHFVDNKVTILSTQLNDVPDISTYSRGNRNMETLINENILHNYDHDVIRRGEAAGSDSEESCAFLYLSSDGSNESDSCSDSEQ